MSAGQLISGLSILCLLLSGPCFVWAQDDGQDLVRFSESVSLDTDSSLLRRLVPVNDYLEEKQWGRAVDILGQIAEEHGRTLIEVSPGRYVNVALYLNMLLARLPGDGLSVYRKKIDPQARQWFEAAKTRRDEELMRKVVRHAFVSSYGDDALLLLGDWAWERGEPAVARSYWKRLLPLSEEAMPGRLPAALRFPDSDYDRPVILARLVLATLVEGDMLRADRELRSFQRQCPDAEGKLAGRTGKLIDILQAVAAESRFWDRCPPEAGVETFAGNPQRNKVLPRTVDVGAPRWNVSLSKSPFRTVGRSAAHGDEGPLSYHPVLFGDMVLVNDAHRIFAYNLRTGESYWKLDENDTNAAIYTDLADEKSILPERPQVGVPRYTLTVHAGRCYAKMGSPVTGRAKDEHRSLNSDLVCLDLIEREGDLVWKIPASRKPGQWSFEGSPLVADGRVFIAMRRSQPRTQVNVACYDAETGSPVWNRRVCAAIPPVGEEHNFIGHQLLTLAEETVFYSTGMGAIAALDVHDGMLRWVVTYETRAPEPIAALSDHTKQGLLPCLFHQGTLFAAPNDAAAAMAIDAQTGIVKWRRRLPKERIRHLLGVGGGNLIVSGNSIWGLDPENGQVVWGSPETDPEFYGYGRGLLVEDTVWWPRREQIEVLDQPTGNRVRQPINLSEKRNLRGQGETAGNLAIADGFLLIAQPDRLVAFSEYGAPPKPPGNHISGSVRFLRRSE